MWAQLIAIWAAFGAVIVLQLLALGHLVFLRQYRSTPALINGGAMILMLILALIATGAIGWGITQDIMTEGVCL